MSTEGPTSDLLTNSNEFSSSGRECEQDTVELERERQEPPASPESPICVTVCGEVREGEGAGDGRRGEVCVTMCAGGDGEGGDEGRTVLVETTIQNGKPLSSTFPQAHKHNYSFSPSLSAGRTSPFECEDQPSSSSSDVASLSQVCPSLSASQQGLEMSTIVEQLKEELFRQRPNGEGERKGGGGEGEAETDSGELTKTLLEVIVTLKMDLAAVKDENQKLRCVRSNMDNEIHELTENLFVEAYKMVDEAKGGKVSAEKRLADASGKIDAMETEMSALKKFIHSHPHTSTSTTGTSASSPTPSSHTLHSHVSHQQKRSSLRRAIRKIQKRTGIPLGQSPTMKEPTTPLVVVEHKSRFPGDTLINGELDEEEYSRFSEWLQTLSTTPPTSTSHTPTPHTSSQHPYIQSIIVQDVQPCLSFSNKELSRQVLLAVQENSVVMEFLQPVTSGNGMAPGHERKPSYPEGVKCALSGSHAKCTHRMRLGEAPDWRYISQSCRDRVVSTCDFFMYLNHIQKGIIKAGGSKLFWQIARLRALMQLSRLNLSLPADSSAH